ncbi:hypothetical protein BpHYR1_015043, partial [Brachionus plicatilis]
MPKHTRVYPKVVKTHDNFRKSNYGNKRVSSSLYQNTSMNELLQINKFDILDQDQTTTKFAPLIEEKLLSQEKVDQDKPDERKEEFLAKKNPKCNIDRLKDFPFVFCAWVVVIQTMSGLAQMCLQVVLLVKNTPLNKVSGGIWSGTYGLSLAYLMSIIIIKRNYRIYIASMFLNLVAIFVFIALAIIN